MNYEKAAKAVYYKMLSLDYKRCYPQAKTMTVDAITLWENQPEASKQEFIEIAKTAIDNA